MKIISLLILGAMLATTAVSSAGNKCTKQQLKRGCENREQEICHHEPRECFDLENGRRICVPGARECTPIGWRCVCFDGKPAWFELKDEAESFGSLRVR